MHTYCSHFVTMAAAFVTLSFDYKHFITYFYIDYVFCIKYYTHKRWCVSMKASYV